jgi:Fibronectin type III-like domain
LPWLPWLPVLPACRVVTGHGGATIRPLDRQRRSLRQARARCCRSRELKAFAEVALAPGETKTVTLSIGREALAYYDDRARQWVAEAGEFDVLIGASAQDIRGTASFTLTSSQSWGEERI